MTTRIFLSYARGDDETFVKRLHADLSAAGFAVWFDRESLMSRGLTFHHEIKDAIRTEVDRVVYVGGPKAALSSYVREEWQFALECDQVVVTPILRLGDYETCVPGELGLLHCEDFRDDTLYPAAMAKLIASLRQPNPKLGALFAVPSLPPHFLGRPELMRRVRDALLVDLQKPQVITSADAKVGMQGMGGIGKSVLAAALARNREVRQSYPDGIIWISCGQKLTRDDLLARLRDVAKDLGGDTAFESIPQGQGVLRELLQAKAVLLVLDDVWQSSDAQTFDVHGPRCRMLVTTRDAGILHALHGELVPVSLFTEPEALQLLADAVGCERPALPPEALEVVRECGCLPLAVALSGGMARKRGGDFRNVLERLHRADLDKISDRASINEQHQSIWRAMQASVEVLSEDEQRRFAELSVFATDRTVPEDAVATLWSHTGHQDDLDTEELLINLAERSLVQLDKKTEADGKVRRRFRLHDLLHDYAMRIAGEPRAVHQKLLDAYQKKCPDGWPSGPNDGYFFLKLCHHLCVAHQTEELFQVLTNYEWQQAKIDIGLIAELLSDFGEGTRILSENDGKCRVLELLKACLRLSAHVLLKDSNQLASQLVGRMPNHAEAAIKSLLKRARSWRAVPWLMPLNCNLHPPGTSLQRILSGHSGRVASVAVTPDGKRVVSASHDATLKIWDLERGQEVRTLSGHRGTVASVAVTLDGKCAVSASHDATLKIWDLKNGSEIRTLCGHSGKVVFVAVTPDGRHAVSASHDTTLKVWDLQTGEELRTLSGHTARVTAVAVTPDGRCAVSASHDTTVKVWDLESGKELRTFPGFRRFINSAVVTPDARFLILACGITLRVLDWESGKEQMTLVGHRLPIASLAVAPDGRRIVSASHDTTLKLWDLKKAKELQTLSGHSDEINSVVLTRDGLCAVSASDDKTVRVWDLKVNHGVQSHGGHTRRVNSVSVTPDGQRAISASSDHTLKIWDLPSGQVIRTLQGHNDVVNAVKVVNGRWIVSASKDKTLKIWDMDSGKEVRTLFGHSDAINSVAVSPDGRQAVSASKDTTLKMWDLENGDEICSLFGHSAKVTSVSITPDGRRAISGSSDITVKIWDLESGREMNVLLGHSETVNAVAVTPDGLRAISASNDASLKIWDVESGIEILTLSGHIKPVSGVAVTPDGRLVVSTSDDNTLKVWDLDSGQCLATFFGESLMSCCACGSTGRVIVAGERSGRMHILRPVFPHDPVERIN